MRLSRPYRVLGLVLVCSEIVVGGAITIAILASRLTFLGGDPDDQYRTWVSERLLIAGVVLLAFGLACTLCLLLPIRRLAPRQALAVALVVGVGALSVADVVHDSR